MREKWKDHEPVEVRLVDLFHGFVEKWMPRTHPHERLHCSAALVELSGQSACLILSEPPQRRTASDLAVVAFGRFSPQSGDHIRHGLSKRRPLDVNDLGVREE